MGRSGETLVRQDRRREPCIQGDTNPVYASLRLVGYAAFFIGLGVFVTKEDSERFLSLVTLDNSHTVPGPPSPEGRDGV